MEDLFLIVGLGNPGREYADTRHNAGFMLVEQLAARWQAGVWKTEGRFSSRVARAERDGRKLLLAQPQTFMNASGQAVRALSDFYRVPVGRILIAVDDADLPLGDIRLRARSGTGGHRGLESVEQHLGTPDYTRLRLGIGRRVEGQRQITGHVLGAFSREEREWLEKVLARAGDQVECWLSDGLEKAMNRFNGPVIRSEKQKETE
jgi:peptidyl-tRNA hydrolase, PTH1 family